MNKYIKPEYDRLEALCQDVITASVTDQGQSSYENANGETVYGNKGAFSAFYDELF